MNVMTVSIQICLTCLILLIGLGAMINISLKDELKIEWIQAVKAIAFIFIISGIIGVWTS